VFGLAFVVEFEVGYNPFMHKTQPQKLFFIAFFSFFVGPTHKTPPPPQKQTPSETTFCKITIFHQDIELAPFRMHFKERVAGYFFHTRN